MIQGFHYRGLLSACAALVALAAGACSRAGAADLAHFPDPAVDEARAAAKGRENGCPTMSKIRPISTSAAPRWV